MITVQELRNTHTYIYIFICIRIYVYVCVCVCKSVRMYLFDENGFEEMMNIFFISFALLDISSLNCLFISADHLLIGLFESFIVEICEFLYSWILIL